MIETQRIFNELKEVHLKLVKINCTKPNNCSFDYFNKLMALEQKQKELNERLKQKGWFFNYELIKMERFKE